MFFHFSKPTHKLPDQVLADKSSKLTAHPLPGFLHAVLAHKPDRHSTPQYAKRATRYRALSLRRQAGQGMTEYIIIVALVAVAAIAVYQYLGQVLRAQTAAVAKELAGEDGTQQSRAAQSAAESAATQAAAKSLKDFTGQAQGSSR